MRTREVVGLLLLVAGVSGVVVGIGSVARDIHLGWAGIVFGILSNLAAYRIMDSKRSERAERAARAASESRV